MSDDFLSEKRTKHPELFNKQLNNANKWFAVGLFSTRSCLACRKKESEEHSLFTCVGCDSAFYCDTECQAKAWKVHKKTCVRHDKIGLQGIRFVPSLYGFFSLPDHVLFTSATEIVPDEEGFPIGALHKVDPGQTFGEILRSKVGNMLIVDSSMYAQIVLLAKYWHPQNDRFFIFTGNKPVGSQMDIYGIPNSSVRLLLPSSQDILDVYAARDEDSVLNIFQGPRPMNLVLAKGNIYRGLSRFQGPISGTARDLAKIATSDLAYWVRMCCTSQRPMTFGSEKTWRINRQMAEILQASISDSVGWALKDMQRPTDEDTFMPEDPEAPEQFGEEDSARDLDDFATYVGLMDNMLEAIE